MKLPRSLHTQGLTDHLERHNSRHHHDVVPRRYGSPSLSHLPLEGCSRQKR